MPGIPGVNHLQAVKAFEKAGFRVARQGKHIVMTDGNRILTIPRNNPLNPFTLRGIVRDAGLSQDEFRKLLQESQRQLHSGLFILQSIVKSKFQTAF